MDNVRWLSVTICCILILDHYEKYYDEHIMDKLTLKKMRNNNNNNNNKHYKDNNCYSTQDGMA